MKQGLVLTSVKSHLYCRKTSEGVIPFFWDGACDGRAHRMQNVPERSSGLFSPVISLVIVRLW